MSKTSIAIIIVAVLLLSLSGLQFAVFNQSVYLPEYWRAQCIERAESMTEIQLQGHTDDPKFYYCRSGSTGTWIPDYSNIQCEYRIEGTGIGWGADVYVCKTPQGNPNYAFIQEDLQEKCTQKRTFFTSGAVDTFVVESGDAIYLDTTQPIGDVDLYAKFPSYGLKIVHQTNYQEKTTETCLASDLDRSIANGHTLNLQNAIEVFPDNPVNIVTGSSLAKSTQVVTLPNVEGGQPIFIIHSGGKDYYKVKEAEDGFLYVDTQETYSNNAIECIPRTTGCSDDAKIIELKDQSCDQFGGAITDFAPVQGDNTKLCKYECSDGKLKLTNNCQAVPTTACPSDKPVWSSETGKCIAVNVEQTQPEEQDLFYLYLIAGVVGAMLLIVGIRLNRGKKR